MTIVGLDDTDSRERGMCTTYVAAVLSERLAERGLAVRRHLLVRCNPAVEHKTRGNAAVALHVESGGDGGLDLALDVARRTVCGLAETDDPNTHPGVVVADGDPADVPDAVREFARDAVGDHLEVGDAERIAAEHGYRSAGWGEGRGRIGALAAVGAWRATDDWTYEHVAYREPERWGEPRSVDAASVAAAADERYPTVWDTLDRTAGETVCVPHTPGPVLYGIRGDDPGAVEAVADAIESETVERAVTFRTNQGTDAHLREGVIGDLADGRAYRADGIVASDPETRRGGHVFVEVGTDDAAGGRDPSVDCVAFEPTKRFRHRVRALRPGDSVTVCGEVAAGTLKLEKFAVRDLVETERAVPTCEECSRTMESAGADQGYRCRDCGTSSPGLVEMPVERDLEPGWYEVPPVARRHVAKPLVRGGFDAPVHPER